MEKQQMVKELNALKAKNQKSEEDLERMYSLEDMIREFDETFEEISFNAEIFN